MFQGDKNDLCWSHFYYDDNDDSLDWKPCKPKGFGAQGWSIYAPIEQIQDDATREPLETCGTACTEFMPH